MRRRRIIFSLIGCLISLLAISLASAGENTDSPNPSLTQKQCDELVSRLVSTAKPPFSKDYVLDDDESLKKIDTKAQARVKQAYDKLSDIFAAALPALVRHAFDGQFSYVYEDVGTSEVVVRADVGGACCRIIEAHIEVYRDRLVRYDFAEIPRCPSFIAKCGGVEKWWKTRKHKDVTVLQLEAIEWALTIAKTRGFQTRPQGDAETNKFESEKAKKDAIKALQSMADGIRNTGKPIVVEHHIQFFGK